MNNHDPQDAPVNKRPVRVWLIPCFNTNLGRAVAETVLSQGDIAVIGSSSKSNELVSKFPETCSIVDIDSANQALCQSAVASAVLKWNRIDIVLRYVQRVLGEDLPFF
jgi:NADP-dependent 3-hydroxy acid dehydrogenase YdfG